MSDKKVTAKITLIGMLTLAVGRFRFEKNKPMMTSDENIIKYCKNHPDFRYQEIVVAEEKPSAPATPENTGGQETGGEEKGNEDNTEDKEPEANQDNSGEEKTDTPTGPTKITDEDLDGLDVDGQSDTESPQGLMRKE